MVADTIIKEKNSVRSEKQPRATVPDSSPNSQVPLPDNETYADGMEYGSSKTTLWVTLKRYFGFKISEDGEKYRFVRPDAQAKAQLLFHHCIAAGKNVSESVHGLFILGEHYASEDAKELDNPEVINGIPPFFKKLSRIQKSTFCYNQVTEALSSEAHPVTIDSLLATRRLKPSDPLSSIAGRFVVRVTYYVTGTLFAIGAIAAGHLVWNELGPQEWKIKTDSDLFRYSTWVAFGCVGALVHLLNHALTTTRLKTFDLSEERKVGPRILLGGMFGFILPWLLNFTEQFDTGVLAFGTMAAFFGGYSVRFAIGLLERLLEAVMPETN